MKKIKIGSRARDNGFSIFVDNKKYTFNYPNKIWQRFPKELRKKFSETAAYYFTFHTNITKQKPLTYSFAPPSQHSLFFQGYLYAAAAANVEIPNRKLNPIEIIKQIYNAGYFSEFTLIPSPRRTTRDFITKPQMISMPFTFGKDSLLTFGLSQELGFQTELIYFAEPTSPLETKYKKELALKFFREFHSKVQFVENTLGHVRQKDNLMWGWDMLVTQYTLLLIPYLWHNRSRYLFWSHEQSVNSGDGVDRGFRINVSHEQSSQWMLHLNNLLHDFSAATQLGSILEPLQEISIMYILHKRFPNLGKYQHSCLGDRKNKLNSRWCGNCYECVRVYLFLRAIGIDPLNVGFNQNLFSKSKRKHFLIFEDKELEHREKTFDHYSERMLAFYLAYQRGFRSGVITLFEQYYLPLVKQNIKNLATFYTKQFPGLTVPSELSKTLGSIYQKELAAFYKEIMRVR